MYMTPGAVFNAKNAPLKGAFKSKPLTEHGKPKAYTPGITITATIHYPADAEDDYNKFNYLT